MGIGVTVFILFMFVALPSTLEHSIDQWERLGGGGNSEEGLRAKFVEHPSYKAMYDRFPDAKEDFSYNKRGGGHMMVGVMNFEANSQLILDLSYNDYEDDVYAHAYCNTESNDNNMHVDELFVEDFIRNTGCLELTDNDDDDDDDDKPAETQGAVTVLLPHT